MTKTKIAKEIGIWLVTLLLVLIFGSTGIQKFPDHGFWKTAFRAAGFPDWFRLLIGVIEIAAAAVILIPRTAAYAAASMIVVMIGAFVTALTVPRSVGLNIVAPSVAMLLAAIVLLARWRERVRV
ncbi:MAG TPA: DoxX family protein [Thermoanaerobaculia bacterium]|nr:DoxX family protein [Thermoanaerobaculia bacterium]